MLVIAAFFALGFLIPSNQTVPVRGATSSDWNHGSYWHHPWGKSGVHKGIDIFAPEGTPVVASVGGFVVFSETISAGGNVVGVLGPKWRLHYYAHMESVKILSKMGYAYVNKYQIGTKYNCRPVYIY